MVNLNKLKSAINDKGIKLQYVADRIGIDRSSLYLKLSGEREFKVSEIEKLSSLLDLSGKARNDIFFAKEGDQ